MTRRVVILGCGYVGLELGRQLDCEVVGVRRSESGIDAIESAGLTGVQADVTDADELAAVPDADVVVFAASSGGRGADAARDVYVEGQRTALDQFSQREHPPERYIYTSSTGVYGDHGGDWVDEETALDPTTEKTRVLAEAERVAGEGARECDLDGTVARLAGLYGPGRLRIERYVEGPVTEGYLNLTHRDDAAGAIDYFIREDCAREEVVLVVDDEPVSKWELADWLADQVGESEPAKRTIAERLADDDLSKTARRRLQTSKRCRNDKLHALGYELSFPTFRDGYQQAIQNYRKSDG
jgi:nucleoside-diphosphate-sugar epimerase